MLNSQYRLGSMATEFLAGNDNTALEFLRVRDSNNRYHNLIASANGIMFESTEGNTKTVHWQAALKSELGNPGAFKIIDTEVNDLNDPPIAFILQTSANANIPGFPSALGGNRVLVVQLLPRQDFSAQLAFSFGSDRMAIRRRYGNTTWTDWKYFTAS